MKDQRTKYIEHLIGQNWPNLKVFAESINIPYTTLRSMLQRGIGNASVNNVIKVCQGLGISTDELIYWGNLFDIGSKIKEERINRGITIEELALKSKISSKELSQIEEGIIPVTSVTLNNITNVFGMTTQKFLMKYDMYDDAELHYFHQDSSDENKAEKGPQKNEIETIAAHHDGDEWTDEELDEIERFKEFVKSRRKQQE